MKVMKSNLGIHKIVVLGLGLLGGSLCKKIKTLNAAIQIVACGRNIEKILPAQKDGIVDEVITYNDPLPNDADIYVVAVPVESSITLIQHILDTVSLKKTALVIDVGSVKQEIVHSIVKHDKSSHFVGCHPMAGSEKSGYTSSLPDLYDDASVIVTPHSNNKPEDIEKIMMFWEWIGARCKSIDAGVHDTIVGYTSHLPHMLSAALVTLISQQQADIFNSDILHAFIGGGFRDMTRIAEGSVDMWNEIALMNKTNICHALEAYVRILQDLRTKIQDCDSITIKEFLSHAVLAKKELSS
jgi:prephenate dehydrogenase